MEKATTVEEFIEPDIQFHLAIAKQRIMTCWLICQNAGFTFAAIDSSHQSTPKFTRSFITRHKAILTAIENKDPLSARHASLVQLDDTKMAYDLIKNNFLYVLEKAC